MGLLFAAFAFFEVKYQLTKFIWGVDKTGVTNVPGAFWISLLILAGIAVYLVKVPIDNAGAADEPAPPSANF